MTTLSAPITDRAYHELKSIGRTAAFCAKFALAVMILGSAVRATDSGLACPDWPLCFGEAIPYFDTHIFMEWFHRVVAGGFAIASLVLGHKILRSNAHRQTFFVMMLAVVLLLTWQIILGALTVLELLNPGIVAWHLMNAVLLYTIIEIIGIKASAKSLGRIGHVALSPRVYRYLLALTMAIFIQLFIGGMVASNEAGLMCPDFPTCFGSWWPRISWLSSLQMVHRFAGFSIIVFAVFVLFALRQTALPPAIRKTVSVMPALLALQILLGAINVMWHLPAWASVMHLALALVMYALLVNATAVCRFCYSTDSLNLEAESVAGGLEVAKIKA